MAEEEPRRSLWRALKRPVEIVGGALLVLVGLAGLVLPIMPGWVLVIPGVALLTAGTPAGDWLLRKLRAARERLCKHRKDKEGS